MVNIYRVLNQKSLFSFIKTAIPVAYLHFHFVYFRSIGFMFIFSFFFFLFTAIFFLIGIHLHVLCRELKDGGIIDKVSSFEAKYHFYPIVSLHHSQCDPETIVLILVLKKQNGKLDSIVLVECAESTRKKRNLKNFCGSI